MTKLLKSTRGITLIALVITIIVLLILAGVALSLVLGENGITNRAVNAGKVQNISGAKEKLELDVANYGAEFYQAKYVNGSLQNDVDTIQEYIMSKFTDNTPYADGYTLTIPAENQLKLTENFDGETYAIATIGSDGKVSWGAIVTPVANPGGGNGGSGSSGGSQQQTVSLSIGDDVDYTTSLNGVTLDDWKVFYTEENYTYLIYGDYLPNEAISDDIISTYGLSASNYYGVYWDDSTNFTNAMTTKENWDSLLTGSINGHTISETRTENVWAIGTPTVDLWVTSWNANYPSDTLYTAQTESTMDEGLNGYYIGDSENPTSSYVFLENSNTLYFPEQDETTSCEGYWLASPSGYDDYSIMTAEISEYSGYVGYGWYDGYYGGDRSLRPIIKLPNSVFSE